MQGKLSKRQIWALESSQQKLMLRSHPIKCFIYHIYGTGMNKYSVENQIKWIWKPVHTFLSKNSKIQMALLKSWKERTVQCGDKMKPDGAQNGIYSRKIRRQNQSKQSGQEILEEESHWSKLETFKLKSTIYPQYEHIVWTLTSKRHNNQKYLKPKGTLPAVF